MDLAFEQKKVVVTPTGMIARKHAAPALGKTVKTLADWSLKGTGPRPVKIGGRVFYRWDEVQAFAQGKAA